MDLITGGLIGGTALLGFNLIGMITDRLDGVTTTFKQLGLENYKIPSFPYKTANGKKVTIQCLLGGNIDELEKNREKLEKAFSGRIIFKNIPYSNLIEMHLIKFDISDLDYKPIELSPYQILCGFDNYGEPIFVDMKVSTHLLVTGLGGNGKTGMVRILIKNIQYFNKADVVLLNGFDDDFGGFNLRHITDHGEIKEYIQSLLNGYKRDRPLYIVFEELGKVKDKELIDLCTKLLQYGRHNNIYMIGIIQTATREELKFKNLFNARLTFRLIEESGYKTVLGCDVPEVLKKREFYLVSNDFYKGKTYKLDF